MKLLKDRILADGKCFPGGILKVDNFINHQMDPTLMQIMAEELARRFSSHNINKIITIEASGIAPAIMVGAILNVPVLFAKKTRCLLLWMFCQICQRPSCLLLRE